MHYATNKLEVTWSSNHKSVSFLQRKLNKQKSDKLIKSRRNQVDSIQSFDVTVPEGYAPGDKLKVLFKQQQISVVIPTGVYPGETFEVRLQKRPQNFKGAWCVCLCVFWGGLRDFKGARA